MKLFQPQYKDKRGKTKQLEHWYIGFTDNQQIRRRLPGFRSEPATKRAATMLGELLSGNLATEVQKWLEEIPEPMRAKLVEWGLVDSRKWSVNLGKNLAEHLADYVSALRADGRKERHVTQTQSQIEYVLTGCDFRKATDIDAFKAKTFLAKSRGPDGFGERTYNAYLVAFKGFCSWLWREGRATGANPMRDCSRVTQTEFRKKRRALTDDEVTRLLTATENGPRHHKLRGRERALIYRLSLTTGARLGEIQSLTVASFDFPAVPPTVHLEPCDTKGKRPADMIMLADVAADIRAYLQDKAPAERAFPMPCKLRKRSAEMLRADLRAAGIPYTDDAGRDADFHSLRHTFITNLCRAGVHPAVAQKLARHANITTTMKYYTHVLRESEIDAMQRLARLSSACPNDAQLRTLADVGGQKNAVIGQKTALSA